MQPPDAAIPAERMQAWAAQLACGFAQVGAVFEDCMAEAARTLSAEGMHDYLEHARSLGRMGRGAEPVLIFLQEWPQVARVLGESALPSIMDAVRRLGKSPNGQAIAPLLNSLAAIARRLPSAQQVQHYLELSLRLMEHTSGSIHGIHKTYASPGLIDFYAQSPRLLGQLSIEGLRNWVEYGVRNYSDHPQHQRNYFGLQSADSLAVLQRERHGTLLVDQSRRLDLYLRALWRDCAQLVPYSSGFDELRQPIPYFDALGIRLPDVYDERNAVPGIDRYRAALAHMAAHRRWSSAMVADNYSPFQRLAIEFFEDARVETLAMRAYPGLRRIFLALHPAPVEGECDPRTHSCLRHRLAMLSRALLHPAATDARLPPTHGYRDPDLNHAVQGFHATMARGESSSAEIASLALSYVARTRRQSDQLATTFFRDTVIDYRDDNRHLWRFHEPSDDEEMFEHQPRPAAAVDPGVLPARHYPEWDYTSQTYRPDWVSLYERLHPSGNPADIDALLAKHGALARRLKRLLDLLKPQDRVRMRHQEHGSELDLDMAIRALIDLRSGGHPDPRVHMSHRTDGRSIAVMLLLDLSESLNQLAVGSEQTVLELSQEAVALLAWSIDQLGDRFAIAGFHSDTRHDVRYLHIKGFSESWNDDAKARLAALRAGYSTRMGAAMRHAAHYLGAQAADKKLLLVLTDGQPADLDVPDERLLIEDARQSVRELDQQGIFSYCISLDRAADSYVGDIFGHQYTVIDRIERLPEQLPKLFMALTR